MKRIVIVSGAPGSGKNTFVDERRTDRDIIIDMDWLAYALGAPDFHGDHTVHLGAALAAREAVYSYIERRIGAWNTAYIVTASPDMDRIKRLAMRLRASIVTMHTPEDECIRRVHEDITRQGREHVYERLIREWYHARR